MQTYFAAINVSLAQDNEIVAAIPGKKIKVLKKNRMIRIWMMSLSGSKESKN